MMTEAFEADCKRTAELIPKEERQVFFETACIEECSELTKVLCKGFRNKAVNKEELLDETGDVLGTLAGVLREHGYTLQEAMLANMEKRRVRHPTPAPAVSQAPLLDDPLCIHGQFCSSYCQDCGA